MTIMHHQNAKIRQAIIQLNDALCEQNRATGRDVVLIVREGSFAHRSLNGKPVKQEWVSDEDLLSQAAE